MVGGPAAHRASRMTQTTTRAIMPFIARDPHHNGKAEWGWDGNRLWHRQVGNHYWTIVKRIHPTPRRVAVLAELMKRKPGEENCSNDVI